MQCGCSRWSEELAVATDEGGGQTVDERLSWTLLLQARGMMLRDVAALFAFSDEFQVWRMVVAAARCKAAGEIHGGCRDGM